MLKENKVVICKIIEFTDQAPSQYKNKTAFNYLTKRTVPVLKNFFGVHHGKSFCDACTGRVKQGVTRLVQMEAEVVNSAKIFDDTCIKHLQKPKSHDCQHHILTFDYHHKLKSRPDTKKWPAIPETRKFHSIGNMKNGDVYLVLSCAVSKAACMVLKAVLMMGVLINGEVIACQGEKNCQPNRSWWSSTANDQIRKMG